MTYPKLPGLTWDGTIYENEEMGDLEALIPNGGCPRHLLPPAQGRNRLERAGRYFRRSKAQRTESLSL